jgi:hypothetical protein
VKRRVPGGPGCFSAAPVVMWMVRVLPPVTLPCPAGRRRGVQCLTLLVRVLD